MIFDPRVVFPLDVSCAGPASEAKITCPLGRMAAAASSAPKGAEMPFNVPLIAGPAAQLFEDGVYKAVRLLAPIWKTRPSSNRSAGPSSKLIVRSGRKPLAEPSAGLLSDQ